MKKIYKNPFAHTAIVALVTVCTLFSYGQTVDSGFLTPLVLRQGNTIAIAKGPGKKVYLAGDIDFHTSTPIKQVVRLYSDGSLDTAFNPDLPEYSEVAVEALDVLPNGKVIVLMRSQVVGTVGIYVLDKYGAKTLERQFGIVSDATCVRALADNTILIGRGGSVEHYTENLEHIGQLCSVGGDDPYVRDIEVVGSKIVISGEFNHVIDPVRGTYVNRTNVARLNTDGTIDLKFDANLAVQAYGPVVGICVQPDQKVILEKKYRTFDSSVITSMRLNADGSPDTQFNNNYPSTLTIDEAHYNNGKITIVNKSKIARLNLDGTLDASFKPVVFNPAKVRAFVLSDDFVVTANYPKAVYGITKISPVGVPSITYKAELTRKGVINSMDRTAVSIYIGGDFIKVNNHFTKNVARLNLNGTVLRKFKVTFDPGVVTQVDGFSDAKALINTSNTLMRLKHDGTFDAGFSFTPFGGLNKVTKFIRQDDGRILIGAPSKIFRIHANGRRDNSFNAAIGGLTNAYYFDFDLDRPTGKIIFTGVFDGQPLYATLNTKRLNPDGSIDPAFTSQSDLDRFGGHQRIMFLDNLEVLIMSMNTIRQPTKLHASGSVDSDFLDNYNPAEVNYQYHEKLQRFGDRIIMGGYDYYSQSLITDAFFEDGQIDTHFSLPVSVGQFYDFYADNDRELFVLGDISYAGASKPWQMAKIIYDSPSALALAGEDGNSGISFYPNPAKTFIAITNTDEAFVNIYSLTGESKIKANVSSSQQKIDISNLAKGHYVIQIKEGGRFYKKHFIKE